MIQVPDLSIVIPTYNHVDRLKVTIEQLALQEGIERCEALVVNDGSTDETKAYLDSLTFDWLIPLHQENLGRSEARNAGIRQASANFILFLDSDIVLGPGYLKQQLAAQVAKPGIYFGNLYNIHFEQVELFLEVLKQSQKSGYLKEKLISFETEDLLVNMARYFQKWSMEGRVSWPCLTAANFSVPKFLLEEAGPFDTTFTGWGVEDHEFAFRLKQVGGDCHFLEEIYGFHLDKAKGHIDIPLLVENLMYFYKKTKQHPEVRAYLEFVSGHNTLQELFRKTLGVEPRENLADIYFRPYGHIKGKQVENVEGVKTI